MKDYSPETALKAALEAAHAAGNVILEVYHKPDFKTELKDDASPVTEADHAAHAIISDLLRKTGIPVLSEEGKEIQFDERKSWSLFWLVDPLDGTKEFIRRNGEFTVNIALIHKHSAILGVLYAPFLDVMYYSETSRGAFRIEQFSKIWEDLVSSGKLNEPSKALYNISKALYDISESLPLEPADDTYRVVASRSHINKPTKHYIKSLKNKHPDLELVSRGSALKFCLIAEGSANIYPRFGPTWEWDTGAGQAIAEAAGCKVTLLDEKNPLTYNKENLLNPGFIVKRD